MANPTLVLNQNYVQLGLGTLNFTIPTTGNYNVSVRSTVPSSLPTGAGSGSARDQGLGATGGFPGVASALQTTSNGQTGLGQAFPTPIPLATATPNLPPITAGNGQTGLGFGGTANDQATGFSTGYGAGAGGGGEGFTGGDLGLGHGGTGQGFGAGNGYQQPPVDIHSSQTTGPAVSSALRIQVLKNGISFYTSPVLSATQQTFNFNIGFQATASDLIQVGFFSSNSSDSALVANVSIGQGLQAPLSAGSEAGFQTVGSTFLTSAASQSITLGNVDSFDYTQPFSASIWFKINAANSDALTGRPLLFSKELNDMALTLRGWAISFNYPAPPKVGLRFTLCSNFETPNFASIITNSTVSGHVWHNVIVTSDGTGTVAGMKIYQDGVLASSPYTISDTLSATIVNTAPMQIGGFGGAGGRNFFDGNVNNASLWNVALSSSDVTRIYNSGTPINLKADAQGAALLGWWFLGSPPDNSTTTFDQTTNANNGTLNNNPTISNDVP